MVEINLVSLNKVQDFPSVKLLIKSKTGVLFANNQGPS